MINSVQLKNFGPLVELDWQNLGQINLVIGNNGCGKSFLLKAMYSAVRTLEDYKRGKNPDSAEKILADKLYWTFQAEKIGDLVTKQSDAALSFSLIFNQQNFSYSFDKEATHVISDLKNEIPSRSDNSIYLPAKEVLSILDIILESRQKFKFGFDDTYLDLAKTLDSLKNVIIISVPLRVVVLDPASRQTPHNPEQWKHPDVFKQSCIDLEEMIDGRIEYNLDNNRWEFKKNKSDRIFSVGVMAEGLKKIAILDTLLGRGYLSKNSIIFIDEPESALHPKAISDLLDIITILAKHGIQFFMASHSYFVIKKLFLIAQEQKMSIPVLSYQDSKWVQSDLKEGLPDNPIIDESIRLYEQEVDLAFK